LLLLMTASVFGKTGSDFTAEQTLSIRLYNAGQASGRVLRSATDQASGLFGNARIRLRWKCLSTESPEDEGTDMTSSAFEQPETRAYIVVRLMTRVPGTLLPGALGYALPFAHRGAHVVIFYDRAEMLAHTANKATYIVLGHIMAHEIGHVLLGSSEHASGGLMQACWTPATWRLASAGLLAFSLEEAERMAAGVQRFRGRNISPMQKPMLSSFVLRSLPE
jgi:hypothetical protein